MTKTYDRQQVLMVAAQLLGHENWSRQAVCEAVDTAKVIIDEVERQCPLPGEPKPTPRPGGGR